MLDASGAEVIGEIFHAIVDKPEFVAAIRQVMQVEDTESDLDSLRQSNPAVVQRLVIAAVKVLANSINLPASKMNCSSETEKQTNRPTNDSDFVEQSFHLTA